MCGRGGIIVGRLAILFTNKGNNMLVELAAHSVDIILSMNRPYSVILLVCRKRSALWVSSSHVTPNLYSLGLLSSI